MVKITEKMIEKTGDDSSNDGSSSYDEVSSYDESSCDFDQLKENYDELLKIFEELQKKFEKNEKKLAKAEKKIGDLKNKVLKKYTCIYSWKDVENQDPGFILGSADDHEKCVEKIVEHILGKSIIKNSHAYSGLFKHCAENNISDLREFLKEEFLSRNRWSWNDQYFQIIKVT